VGIEEKRETNLTISGGSCDQGFTPVDDLPLFIGFDMSRKSATVVTTSVSVNP
jgi:hypothetical protein